jgi:hypothetical protein
MAKVLKVFNQEVEKGSIIRAHIMRTDGSQEMKEYSYRDFSLFLQRLNVPHTLSDTGMSRLLQNTFAATATRVFLNWIEDQKRESCIEYWCKEVDCVTLERTEFLRSRLSSYYQESPQPPNVQPGSASSQQYASWQYQQLEPSFHY